MPLLMMSSQRRDSPITFSVENRRVARRALALARALGLTRTFALTCSTTRSVSSGSSGAGRVGDLAAALIAASALGVPTFPPRAAARSGWVGSAATLAAPRAPALDSHFAPFFMTPPLPQKHLCNLGLELPEARARYRSKKACRSFRIMGITPEVPGIVASRSEAGQACGFTGRNRRQ